MQNFIPQLFFRFLTPKGNPSLQIQNQKQSSQSSVKDKIMNELNLNKEKMEQMLESSQAFRRYNDKTIKSAKNNRVLTPKEKIFEKEKKYIEEILQKSDDKIKKIKGRKSSLGTMGSMDDPTSPELPKEKKLKAPRIFSPNVVTLSLDGEGQKVSIL